MQKCLGKKRADGMWQRLAIAAYSIAASIWDGRDDVSNDTLVEFEPFANGPVEVEKKSLGSFKAMYR